MLQAGVTIVLNVMIMLLWPALQRPNHSNITQDDFITLQKIYHANNVNVPKIYDYNLSKGYLLEEDLGDVTLLKYLAGLKESGSEFESYKKSLDELVKIHSIAKAKYVDESFTQRFFNEEKLMWEVAFTHEYLIEGFLKTSLGNKKNKFFEIFGVICKKLIQGKMVVAHRDYHARNLMFKNGDIVVIDFQDTRIGLPQYDLVLVTGGQLL